MRMKPMIFVTFLGLFGSFCPYNSSRNYSVADGVQLAVIGQEANSVHLKIRNDRKTPIFLGYQRGDGTTTSEVGYGLVCYKRPQDATETDFGPDSDSAMALNPLNPGDQIEFTVSPLPKLKRNCSIAVGYYSNTKAVDLVKRLAAQRDVYTVTDDEGEFLEQSAEKIFVTVNVDE